MLLRLLLTTDHEINRLLWKSYKNNNIILIAAVTVKEKIYWIYYNDGT